MGHAGEPRSTRRPAGHAAAARAADRVGADDSAAVHADDADSGRADHADPRNCRRHAAGVAARTPRDAGRADLARDAARGRRSPDDDLHQAASHAAHAATAATAASAARAHARTAPVRRRDRARANLTRRTHARAGRGAPAETSTISTKWGAANAD